MFATSKSFMRCLAGATAVAAVALLQGCGGGEPGPAPAPTPAPSAAPTPDPGVLFRDWASERGVAGTGVSFAVALADVDGDGDLDMFVTNSEESNRLYLNSNGQGRYIDATAASGLADEAATSRGAVFGDVNGDGLLDLFVTARSHTNRLFRGDGTGKFADVTLEAGVNNTDFGQGACFADVDSDGDLDLFVSNFEMSNLLYRNDGQGVFEDVTVASGLRTETGGFACVFGDVDEDGDLDLYVSNGGALNKLYLNDGAGVFTDVTAEAGAGVSAGQGRGVQFADFNADGHLDVVAVAAGEAAAVLLGDGTGNFSDFSDAAGVGGVIGAAQGVNTLDWDGDGDIDILVSYVNAPNVLWDNDGLAVFRDVTADAGVGTNRFGQGIAVGDVDGDGALDVSLVSWGDYPSFCEGCTPNNMLLLNRWPVRKWLKVRPVRGGSGHATFLGAEVRVFEAGTQTPASVRQRVDGGSGFAGQNAYEAYFGLHSSDASTFDVELRCGGQNWITKADDSSLGGVAASTQYDNRDQVLEVWCPPSPRGAGLVAQV